MIVDSIARTPATPGDTPDAQKPQETQPAGGTPGRPEPSAGLSLNVLLNAHFAAST